MRTCFECKFYDAVQCVCMYDCRSYCILKETDSAKDCQWYKDGKFNWDELERTNYL